MRSIGQRIAGRIPEKSVLNPPNNDVGSTERIRRIAENASGQSDFRGCKMRFRFVEGMRIQIDVSATLPDL